jgi:hypothetical protein
MTLIIRFNLLSENQQKFIDIINSKLKKYKKKLGKLIKLIIHVYEFIIVFQTLFL